MTSTAKISWTFVKSFDTKCSFDRFIRCQPVVSYRSEQSSQRKPEGVATVKRIYRCKYREQFTCRYQMLVITPMFTTVTTTDDDVLADKIEVYSSGAHQHPVITSTVSQDGILKPLVSPLQNAISLSFSRRSPGISLKGKSVIRDSLTKDPHLTASEIREILKNNCLPIPAKKQLYNFVSYLRRKDKVIGVNSKYWLPNSRTSIGNSESLLPPDQSTSTSCAGGSGSQDSDDDDFMEEEDDDMFGFSFEQNNNFATFGSQSEMDDSDHDSPPFHGTRTTEVICDINATITNNNSLLIDDSEVDHKDVQLTEPVTSIDVKPVIESASAISEYPPMSDDELEDDIDHNNDITNDFSTDAPALNVEEENGHVKSAFYPTQNGISLDCSLSAASDCEMAMLNSNHSSGPEFVANSSYGATSESNMDPSTVCVQCQNIIRNTSNLEVHMRRHIQYRPYVCSQCRYAGYDAEDVERHIKRSHKALPNTRVKHEPDAETDRQVMEMIETSRTVGNSGVRRPAIKVEDTTIPTGKTQALSSKRLLGSSQQQLNTSVGSSPTSSHQRKRKHDSSVGVSIVTESIAVSNHQSVDLIRCSLCSKQLVRNALAALQHLRSHFVLPSYTCPCCDQYSVDGYQGFISHLNQIHSMEADLPAVVEQAQTTLYTLMTELASVAFSSDSAPLLQCNQCFKPVGWNKEQIENHLSEHNAHYSTMLKCAYCNTKCVQVASLVTHMNSNHRNALVIIHAQPPVLSLATKQQYLDTLFQCFPLLTPESIEEVQPEKCGASFNGNTVVVMPQAPEMTIASAVPINGLSDDSQDSSPGPTQVKMGCTQCVQCLAMISRNVTSLISHAKTHLSYQPLRCSLCTFRHYAMTKMHRHLNKMHANKSARVTYHPVPGVEEKIKDMWQKCFGPISGHPDEISRAIKAAELGSSDDVNSELTLPPQGGRTSVTRSSLPSESTPKRLLQASNLPSFSSPNSLLSSEGSNEIGGGMGKKMCFVCKVYIANNASSFENHACKHLDYKPYHCQYCQYQSYIRGKVTRHIQQVHHGLPIKISHEPLNGIKEKIADMKAMCFPFLERGGPDSMGAGPAGDDQQPPNQLLPPDANSGASSPTNNFLGLGGVENDRGAAPSPMSSTVETVSAEQANDQSTDLCSTSTTIRCRLCYTQVSGDIDSKEQHLQQHIVTKQFWCPLCNFNAAQISRVKQHTHTAHLEQQVSHVLCCPPEGPMGLVKLRSQCFPETESMICVDDDDSLMDSDLRIDTGTLSRTATDDQTDFVKSEPSTLTDARDRYSTGAMVCELCDQTVARGTSAVDAHVRGHFDYEPYQCSYCDAMKSTSETDVKTHIKLIHSGSPLKVIYNPERDELATMRVKCFPLLNRMNNSMASSLNSSSSLLAALNSGSNGCGVLLNGVSSLPNNPSASATMRKLSCQICNQTIADNPKSVGIHVKNHLHYKPYKCPFCKYMSCEQSKARRHIEHVHQQPAECLGVETDVDIKEKIADMKQKCFPNLGQFVVTVENTNNNNVGGSSYQSAVFSHSTAGQSRRNAGVVIADDLQTDAFNSSGYLEMGAELHTCNTCGEKIPSESVDYHVRTHVGKQFKCSGCGTKFWTPEKAGSHIGMSHAGELNVRVVHLRKTDEIDQFFKTVKMRCFPKAAVEETKSILMRQLEQGTSLASGGNASSTPAYVQPRSKEQQLISAMTDSINVPTSIISMLSQRFNVNAHQQASKADCRLCDQTIAGTGNSIDVHIKNHLNYKPHQCGYCEYRSCIPGKVKRHLDTVHRGLPLQTMSFTQTSASLKQIFQDMRLLCFPLTAGADRATELDMLSKNKTELISMVDRCRNRLTEELQNLVAQGPGESTADRSASALSETMSAGLSLAAFSQSDGAYPRAPSAFSNNDSMASGDLDESFSSTGAMQDPFGHIPGLVGGKESYSVANKILCHVCMSPVADNPSSIGLHIRNHLDYKPFLCLLCSYRSCIQAKVKRHLRNVHKCSEDRMTCQPDQNIKARVSDMRRQCFPKRVNANDDAECSSIAQSLGYIPTKEQQPGQNDFNLSQLLMAPSLSGSGVTSLECNLCQDIIENDESAKSQHLVKHVQGSHVSPERYEELLGMCFPTNAANDGVDDINAAVELGCQLCDEVLPYHEQAVRVHVVGHMESAHFKCSSCYFVNQERSKVIEHMREEHMEEEGSGEVVCIEPDAAGSEGDWTKLCFPDLDPSELEPDSDSMDESSNAAPGIEAGQVEDDATTASETDEPPMLADELMGQMSDSDLTNDEMSNAGVFRPLPQVDTNGPTRTDTKDGPRYICQICKLPVSMYASSLYTHVKNHMNYKPYACPHCDYRSPVKSKVRRHLFNAHRNDSQKIDYFPQQGIDQEIMRWKKICFPEVNGGGAQSTNTKIPCRLCQTDVADTPLSRSVHAKNHLDAKPFHCAHCTYKSCLRGETRRHITRQHPGAKQEINFAPSELADTLSVENAVSRCFGPNATSEGSITDYSGYPSMVFSTQNTDYSMIGASEGNEGFLLGTNSPGDYNETEGPQVIELGGIDDSATGGDFDDANAMTSDDITVVDESHELVGGGGTVLSAKPKFEVKTQGNVDASVGGVRKQGVLGRPWYCLYCSFFAISKYVVKQHVIDHHPGKEVQVSNVASKLVPT